VDEACTVDITNRLLYKGISEPFGGRSDVIERESKQCGKSYHCHIAFFIVSTSLSRYMTGNKEYFYCKCFFLQFASSRRGIMQQELLDLYKVENTKTINLRRQRRKEEEIAKRLRRASMTKIRIPKVVNTKPRTASF
jgi:hypothetical protein